MYAVLHHKTIHEVSIFLYKQWWSSTRQNIPLETFEVTIFVTLDKRRENGVQLSSKNCSSLLSHLEKLGMA